MRWPPRFMRDLTVVKPVDPLKAIEWGSTGAGAAQSIQVRGLLFPATTRQRAIAAGSQFPIPAYVAYIPFNAVDLSAPGWHLVCDGQTYYPARDAESPGGIEEAWVCELLSPGELGHGAG